MCITQNNHIGSGYDRRSVIKKAAVVEITVPWGNEKGKYISATEANAD